MLDPDHRSFEMHIKMAIAALRVIAYPGEDLDGHIANMPDANRSLRKAKEIYDEANDIRRFFSKTSIATMKNWGDHPGCPIRFYLDSSGDAVHIGRSRHELLRIGIPRSFWNSFGSLPALGDIEVAA